MKGKVKVKHKNALSLRNNLYYASHHKTSLLNSTIIHKQH